MRQHSVSALDVALLIKEERGGGTVTMNIVPTSERADFSIAKETGAGVNSENLLEQAGVVTLAAE
jgi:hypothetical protein